MVDQLLNKLVDAARQFGVKQVCICGGVSANRVLRDHAQQRISTLQIPLYIPPITLCTDNAAMIGAAAYFRQQVAPSKGDGLDIDVVPNWGVV